MPSECSRSKYGCHLPDLGIGVDHFDGNQIVNSYHCCNKLLAHDDGYCHFNNHSAPVAFGTLLIDPKKFKGEHRMIEVPIETLHLTLGDLDNSSFSLSKPKIPISQGSGDYALLLSNCNNRFYNGRDISVWGTSHWVSNHGYLPGNLFQTWKLYLLSSIFHLLLLLRCSLHFKIHHHYPNKIQLYTIIVILSGMVEFILRITDFWYWNRDGHRSLLLTTSWSTISIIKRSLSRCLGVMVCLGWDVVCKPLERMPKICLVGIFYLAISSTNTFLATAKIRGIQTTTTYEEGNHIILRASRHISDDLLNFLEAIFDLFFYLWTFYALFGTIEYLSHVRQYEKIQRFPRNGFFVLLSLLSAISLTVFSIVNAFLEITILNEKLSPIIPAALDVNYLFLLSSITIPFETVSYVEGNANNFQFVSSNLELDPSVTLTSTNNNNNNFNFLKKSRNEKYGNVPACDEDDLRIEVTEHT